MVEKIVEASAAHHPAPHRDRVSIRLLFGGLLLPAAAWSLQLTVNYVIVSRACLSLQTSAATMAMGSTRSGVWTTLLAIDLAALVLVAAGFGLSVRNWLRTREESSGHVARLLEAGEGRTRFLAVWGVAAASWFFAGVVFNTIAVLGVPLCVR